MAKKNILKNAAEARLQNRVLQQGEEGYSHVENEYPVTTDVGIRSLDEVVKSIKTEMISIQARKRLILEELLYLLNNWDYYSKQDGMENYIGESGLYRFLSDRVEQKSSTSYADVRIVRMLSSYRLGHLLKLENKINSLKRIAYINNKRDQSDAERFRKQLLKELPDLTNEEVGLKIEQYNMSKGVPTEVHRKVRRPYELAINPSRGKVLIKDMEPQVAKKMGRLLQLVDLGRIDEWLSQLEEENKTQGELKFA